MNELRKKKRHDDVTTFETAEPNMGSDDGIKTITVKELRSNYVYMLVSFLIGIFVSTFYKQRTFSKDSSSSCEISFGHYGGTEYRSSLTRGTPKCLIESKFLKVQQHELQIEESVIHDWLFIDYHDQINVLVEAPRMESWTEPHFYVFQQTKYALEDRMSLAVVGGIVEPNEKPEAAAKREVSEEMHVVCEKIDFLGRFRADVNRGVGWTFTYLARDCHAGTVKEDGMSKSNEVGAADTEQQNLTIKSLSEILSAVKEGKFLEIKWTATVALSLLHILTQEGDRGILL